MLTQIEIEGYRSVKDLWLKLGRVNVLVGANGCGKSNLYRALWLLHAAARGEFARAIVAEGGMPSALWAGSFGYDVQRMKIGARFDDMRYQLQVGIPVPTETLFGRDPDIKEEHVWCTNGKRKVHLLQREGKMVYARSERGEKVEFPLATTYAETVLSELREPHKYPELSLLRERFLSWRFYHQFRTDMHSPIRRPQAGVRTPVLSEDGSDLPSAIQTILEVGDGEGLRATVERAFPDSSLRITTKNGLFELEMLMPDFNRAFSAQELSDGTLQYLCLLAALMSPRPPALLALNEPENSIHPDLYEALARLIADASKYSQIWLTTHSRELADYILEFTGASPIELEKVDGATKIVGQRLGGNDDDD